MTEDYKKYLKYLNEKLSKFFESQKEYIKCSKGCSKCCEKGEYPYSETELKYLLSGFLELDKKTQDIIEQNILEVIEQKKNTDEKFLYKCPFLINNACSVYEYRGIICRTFGLIDSTNEPAKLPFCAYEGLNYSNVADSEQNIITEKKYKQSGSLNKPLGFNISYDLLTSEKVENVFNFKFGDKKSLIDWFKKS